MGGGPGGSVGMAETPKFMGMGIQSAIAQSQIEVNKASAEKMKAEAIKIAGVDTQKTGTASLAYGLPSTLSQATDVADPPSAPCAYSEASTALNSPWRAATSSEYSVIRVLLVKSTR